MALRLITPPESPPVMRSEAKSHLRIDHDADDALIDLYLLAATAHIDGKDGWLQRCLKPQTWELTYDEFPSDSEGIEIPLPPLISVTSFKYVDEDGVEQTIDSADYVVDVASEPGWLVPVFDYTYPAILETINAVRIRFVAGYEDPTPASGESEGETASNVPAPIKAAILMMVADMYDHRESVSADSISAIPVPATVKALLQPFRIYR